MSYTSFTNQNFNPNGRTSLAKSPASVYGNMSQYRNDIQDLFLTGFSNPGQMIDSNRVAFTTNMVAPDENAFGLSLLQKNNKIAGAFNAPITIKEIMANSSKSAIDTLKYNFEMGIGGIDYIPKNASNQVFKSGMFLTDGSSNNTVTTIVEQYTLDAHRTRKGDPLLASISFKNTDAGVAGVATPVQISISAAKAWASGIKASCMNNSKKTSTSLQRIYIIKKNKYVPGQDPEVLTGHITDYVINADGSMELFVTPAVTRSNPIPSLTIAGSYSWENAGDVIEVGDIIRYGTHQPTNICATGANNCVAVDMPEPTIYCVSTHSFDECIFNINEASNLGTPENQLPAHMYHKKQAMQNVIHLQKRWIADLLYSDQNYAAGQRLDIPVPGVTGQYTQSDCELIPFAGLGILTAIKKYGQKIEHYFSSCNDVCGTALVSRITEMMTSHAMMSNGSLDYNSSTFTLTGDVKGVRNFEEASKGYLMNQFPFTVTKDDVMARQNSMMQSAYARPSNSTMLFGARVNGIQEIHDSVLAREQSDTLYLIPNIGSGFRFFAPDVRGRQNMNHPGLNFGTKPPVKDNGQVVTPYIYSDDFNLRMNLSSDQMEYVANGGCGVTFRAYMNVGLFPGASSVANSIMFRFGYEKQNPDYKKDQPYSSTNQPIIRVSLSEANCANDCSAIDKRINERLQLSYKDGAFA